MSPEFPLILFFVIAAILFSPFLSLLAPCDRKWARRASIVLVVLSLTLVGWVAYLLEISGANLGSWLYTGTALLVALGVSIPIARHFRSVLCAGIAAVFGVSIIAMHLFDFTPIKPFRRFFAAVHEGMTEPEVMAALHREFPEGGRFTVPALHSHPDEMRFFLDPTKGAYDAEGVFVTLRDGKCACKVYYSD